MDQGRTSELGSVGADKSAPVIVEARACIVPAVAPAEAAVMAVSEVPPMTEPAVPEAAAVAHHPAAATAPAEPAAVPATGVCRVNAEGQTPTAAVSVNARVVIFLFMADSVLVRSRAGAHAQEQDAVLLRGILCGRARCSVPRPIKGRAWITQTVKASSAHTPGGSYRGLRLVR